VNGRAFLTGASERRRQCGIGLVGLLKTDVENDGCSAIAGERIDELRVLRAEFRTRRIAPRSRGDGDEREAVRDRRLAHEARRGERPDLDLGLERDEIEHAPHGERDRGDRRGEDSGQRPGAEPVQAEQVLDPVARPPAVEVLEERLEIGLEALVIEAQRLEVRESSDVGRQRVPRRRRSALEQHRDYALAAAAAERFGDFEARDVVGIGEAPLAGGRIAEVEPLAADQDQDGVRGIDARSQRRAPVHAGHDLRDVHEDVAGPEFEAEAIVEAPGVARALAASVAQEDVRHAEALPSERSGWRS
jgi:hypothetical protein